MNAEEFVSIVKLQTSDAAAKDTLKVLERPPGRSPSERLLRLSRWYNQLQRQTKRCLEPPYEKPPRMPFPGFSAYWMV